MADKSISQDATLLAANIATVDLIPVVDISEPAAADRNKNITFDILTTYLNTNLDFAPSSHVGGNIHIDWTVTGGEVIHADRYTNTTYVNGDWDHDQLTNFVANEHIDWTVTGAENIHADRYTNTTYVNSDWDHNQLTNYEANRHIDWTVTGGEVIHADRYTNTIYTHPNHTGDVSSNGDGVTTIKPSWVTGMPNIAAGNLQSADEFPFYDSDVAGYAAITYVNLVASLNPDLDHDSLSGVTANEHIDWTADQGATNIHQNNLANAGNWDAAYTHSTSPHAPSNADNTAANETSHADVVVDGDFAANGLLKRTSLGVYTVVADNSGNWDAAYSHSTSAHAPSDADNTAANETSHADVVVDGDFASTGLMKRGATAGSYSIVTDNSANWNTAFGWGDHSGLYAPISHVGGNIHIDWSITGGEVIHADRYTNTTYVNSDWDHDQLTNYVANEHIDWTNATNDLVTTGTLKGSKLITNTGGGFSLAQNGVSATNGVLFCGTNTHIDSPDTASGVYLNWYGGSNGVYIGDGSQGFGSLRTKHVIINGGNISGTLGAVRFLERADHPTTPAATYGELWVKNSTPNALMFTDDAGTDHELTAADSGGGGVHWKRVELTSTTGSTWTHPSDMVSDFVFVTVVGSGAGGQLASSSSYEGKGGGGGETIYRYPYTVSGSSTSYSVGAGGNGAGTSSGEGGNGEDSWFGASSWASGGVVADGGYRNGPGGGTLGGEYADGTDGEDGKARAFRIGGGAGGGYGTSSPGYDGGAGVMEGGTGTTSGSGGGGSYGAGGNAPAGDGGIGGGGAGRAYATSAYAGDGGDGIIIIEYQSDGS